MKLILHQLLSASTMFHHIIGLGNKFHKFNYPRIVFHQYFSITKMFRLYVLYGYYFKNLNVQILQ